MSFPLLKSGSSSIYQPVRPAYPLSLLPSSSVTERPRVFLTTVRIPDDHIWANGLFQNVYAIYKMFEIMGCEPWLLVDNNENNKDAKIHKQFRLTDFKEYMQTPFKIAAYIELGMSCDPSIRKFFRSMGAKTAKLYLGNILNIDIETITFYPSINFSHHVAGELDEIWVSPHYDIHAEYAGSVNGICENVRIAPYVWDPMFIEDLGHVYDGSSLTRTSARNFIIMEPNISFQKNSLIPIMAMEQYYRQYPDRVENVVVINGAKLLENQYFKQSVLPCLSIFESGKLLLLQRANIINTAKSFKSAIVLQHQVNNEYNYSFLEWMHMGFPVIHNISRFDTYGYYYKGNSFTAAAKCIESVVDNHELNREAYKAHAKQLCWRFSIQNPENLAAWKALALPAAVAAAIP